MEEVVESESGDDLRGLAPLLMTDDSRKEEGVSGALLFRGGDRIEDGSRLPLVDTEVLRSFIGSPPGGDRTAGHNDLSSGNLAPVGSRCARIAAA